MRAAYCPARRTHTVVRSVAQVNIENILEYLDRDLRKALESAVHDVIPNVQFDSKQLYKAFGRAAGRKCADWETVPDRHVKA